MSVIGHKVYLLITFALALGTQDYPLFPRQGMTEELMYESVIANLRLKRLVGGPHKNLRRSMAETSG